MSSKQAIQTLFDARRRAWIPRDGETWDAFVRRKAPAQPAWWQPFDRGHYQSALREALGRGEKREHRGAILLPFWIANNEDEEPRDDEWRRRLVVWSHEEQLSDIELSNDVNFWARVDLTLTRGAFVAQGRHYAAEVPATRFGPFAVVNGLGRIAVERIDAIENLATTPKPKRMAPAFSMLFEPAIDLRDAPREIAEAAEQIVERLQFVNEAESTESN